MSKLDELKQEMVDAERRYRAERRAIELACEHPAASVAINECFNSIEVECPECRQKWCLSMSSYYGSDTDGVDDFKQRWRHFVARFIRAELPR
jgi:hypothetical protein